MLKPLAAAAFLAMAGASHAAITVYTSQATFLAAVTSPGVDTYTGFSITGGTPSPIVRTAGAYGYIASASTSTFFGAGTTANPWLSTNVATDSISFASFTGSVSAAGGNFFGSDVNGAFAAGSVALTATDSLGATSTQTITGATTSSFLGFVSTGAMTSLVLSAIQPGSPLWPTVDNLTLAIAGPVPEVETYAMMLAGLGAMGFMIRRRKR
ncbi:MAG: PEP-CTERM sorting domain-containing protein [Rubrivivax sp.]